MFQDLGLEPEIEMLYRLVVTRRSWTVEELARELDLPEASIEAQLEKLARAQLLLASKDRAAVRAIRPRVALSSVLARQEARLVREQAGLERARQAISEFADLTHDAGIVHEIERVVGIDEIRLRLDFLARTCRNRALSIMPGGAQTAASLEASRPLDEEALRRGVSVLTLYQESIRNDRATLEYAQWLVSLGGECRVAPTLPMRLLVIDDRIGVVPDDDADEPAVFVIEGRALVSGLLELFERVWSQAQPVGSGPELPEDAPTPTERAVLSLLADGCTDEAIAARLAVSLRTVRRVISSLLSRLEARSRFQAGALAERRGWLAEDPAEFPIPGQRSMVAPR